MRNEFEIKARLKKAMALAEVLRKAGCDSDAALRLHPEDWIRTAKAARVNPPSALTIAIVADLLKDEPEADIFDIPTSRHA